MVMRYVHPGESHRIDAVKKLAIANAARQIAEFEKKKSQKAPLQFPLQSPKIQRFLVGRKRTVSLNESIKSSRSDSNRCIKVLQTLEADPSAYSPS